MQSNNIHHHAPLCHIFIGFTLDLRRSVIIKYGAIWSASKNMHTCFAFMMTSSIGNNSGHTKLKCNASSILPGCHDDVIKWKHFPRYWPFERGIHRSPHKSQWRGALMLSLIWAWINGWVNTGEAGDLRRHRADYDVIVMLVSVIRAEIRHGCFAVGHAILGNRPEE